MKDKLKKIGLLRESVQKIDIPKDTFISFFSAMIGMTQEVKVFSKPSYPYFGYISETNFAITENQKPFGNTSSAKVTGEIRSTESGIELRFESLLLAQREYIFIGVGILMFIGGIIKLFLNPSSDIETIILAPFGLFLIVFTYAYMRRDALLAMKNFKNRLKDLKEQNHNNSYKV